MKKSLFSIFLILLAIMAVWALFKRTSQTHLDPAEILGGVVRTENEGTDRLYYLTSQWEKRLFFSSGRVTSSMKTISWLNIDLWEIDATTAQPLSRRRIKQEKVYVDSKALGADQGTLWARIPELVGIRLADGEIVVNRETIAKRNPALADLLPKSHGTATFLLESMQPMMFDLERGMILRLDDAREVLIDPLTSEATPITPQDLGDKRPLKSTPAATRIKMISTRSGTDWYAMVRGIPIPQKEGSKHWIGLLTEFDLKNMQENGSISWQMDFTKPQRSRLFRATLEGVEGSPGSAMWYRNPQVLPESPDFLMAGLLTEEASGIRESAALWRRNPESVFVISYDRLGDDGRLQLNRVNSETGALVWSASLPLSELNAWIPGRHHALIMGPAPSAERSSMVGQNENAVMHLLSIELETGTWQSFNPDLHRDWPVIHKGKEPTNARE